MQWYHMNQHKTLSIIRSKRVKKEGIYPEIQTKNLDLFYTI